MSAKRTESARRTPKFRLAQYRAEGRFVDNYERPRTRGECLEGGSNSSRPCPWAGCRHHMLLDVTVLGGLTLVHGHDDVEQLGVSCSLDVVDALGALTLEDTGALMSVTRERVRQIETDALAAYQRAGGTGLVQLQEDL